jgi:hypothetical protein
MQHPTRSHTTKVDLDGNQLTLCGNAGLFASAGQTAAVLRLVADSERCQRPNRSHADRPMG